MELSGDGKSLHLVGDRVLILPDEGEDRSQVGLYLPATAVDSQPVQGGRIVATGEGDPLPEPAHDDEPWRVSERPVRRRPMQAEVGDHAIFFRKAAVEIRFEDTRYLVVPQAAILVLIRGEAPDR